MCAPYLCTLISSISSQYIFPPMWSLLSITKHFFPFLFASYANIEPNNPDPTIK